MITHYTPWCCFMRCLHSISDVLPVSFSHLPYHLPPWVQYWSRVVSIWPFLSSSNVDFVSMINAENNTSFKLYFTKKGKTVAWREGLIFSHPHSLIPTFLWPPMHSLSLPPRWGRGGVLLIMEDYMGLCRRQPWAPGRFNHAGLVCRRGARQKQHPGPPGWGLGAGLTPLPCKTNDC